MATNDRQVLKVILEEGRTSQTPEVKIEDYFEHFCAEQVLKDFDLSYEEIQAGIVDGEHDGGADAVYAFVNGELVYEDFDTSPFKKDVSIELHIIQSRTADGFSEQVVDKLISLTRNLLQLDAEYEKIIQYNEAVKSTLDGFRSTYLKLSGKFPSLKINYYYAAIKADQHVHENMRVKANDLISIAKEKFPEAAVEVIFLAAPKLVELARRRQKTTFNLKTTKVISAGSGYLILSLLSEFDKFLRDESGMVNRELFESNVRDFQGLTEVNEDIKQTLLNERVVDFWEMNNGITILSSRATLNGETIVIESPQIVNGLQTSSQISSYFDSDGKADNRQVMIKVVTSEDEETRDKIIKATNSQNPIQSATLRATDKVQRDIEEALRSSGLYYDRRKNYYKNEGKPADKIISIPLMAQAVMSIILGQPDNARARPSSLLKDDATYKSLFSDTLPIELYANAALLIRLVDVQLKLEPTITARERTNIRFYVLYWVAAWKSKKVAPKPADVAKINAGSFSDTEINDAIVAIRNLYQGEGGTDQAAKSSSFRAEVIAAMQDQLAGHFKK